jgi:hypothetical protein
LLAIASQQRKKLMEHRDEVGSIKETTSSFITVSNNYLPISH